jgi:adenosylhomocysteine nucleosidase
MEARRADRYVSPISSKDAKMLAVVTGLAAEAQIARRLGLPAMAGGGEPAGAEAAAEAMVAQGATALLSFGLAGGLDAALQPGDILIPDAVVEDGRIRPTNANLSRALGEAAHGMLLAHTAIVASAAEKADLARTTLCRAVDLESGAVARVAERHMLPFAVLRAICDDAARDLPPAALAALDEKGAIAIARVALSILGNPLQIPSLIALGRDAGRAREALVRRVNQIGFGSLGLVL